MTRYDIPIYVTTITALVMSAAIGAEAGAQDRPAAIPDGVEISWLADCTETAEKFFSLHVTEAGAVHYQGYTGAKTLDVAQTTISRSAAKRIGAKAEAFVASTQKQKTEAEPKRGTFCVNVTISRTAGALRSRGGRSDARSAAALLREIEDRIEPRRWACPARKLESKFLSTRYCDDQPYFSLTIGGRTSCDLTQTIEVYGDGTLYSLAYRTRGAPSRQDEYYRIDPAAVKGMVEDINTFEAATMELEEFPPGKTTILYYRIRPEDIQTVRERLTALAPIAWVASQDATGCDEFPGPKSKLTLRPDLDRAATQSSTR